MKICHLATLIVDFVFVEGKKYVNTTISPSRMNFSQKKHSETNLTWTNLTLKLRSTEEQMLDLVCNKCVNLVGLLSEDVQVVICNSSSANYIYCLHVVEKL
jgi:hypothetical protein